MMKNLLSLLITLVVATGCAEKYERPDANVIPKPSKQVDSEGVFVIDEDTKILFDHQCSEMNSIALYATDYINSNYKIANEISVSDKMESGAIILKQIKDSTLGAEGYRLTVNSKNITLEGSHQGIFYGVQTLKQLMSVPAGKDGIVVIPSVTIEDSPRFGYRGTMLDVARHFFNVEEIYKFIDYLALHKMNKFHWHLTEDQGWRIEIKKYPGLSKISSQRSETLVGHGGKKPFKYDGKPYGGFFTQEQVKSVVAYAAARYIEVIPEIELPGHSQAALTAYPELGCTGGPYNVATRWGVFKEVYCAGKEETFEFMIDVIDEVTELFPSAYFHIGGDECPKSRWKECESCQARMKSEDLANEHELQSYFIRRIEKHLNSKGKKLIGWDEILEGGLAPNATVMSWRGISGGIKAAKQGHDVIMTPNSHMYFDHYQAPEEGEPLAIGGYLPLKKVYSYEPLPTELTIEEQKHILGVQANLWTEYMPNFKHVEYMAMPRMAALSEVAWSTKENRDFDNFMVRLNNLRKVYDILDINYCDKAFEGTDQKKKK